MDQLDGAKSSKRQAPVSIMNWKLLEKKEKKGGILSQSKSMQSGQCRWGGVFHAPKKLPYSYLQSLTTVNALFSSSTPFSPYQL